MSPPLNSAAIADLQRAHGRYIYHGADVYRVDGIIAHGLQPGGGPGGRRSAPNADGDVFVHGQHEEAGEQLTPNRRL